MKAAKIILASVVLTVICFFVGMWLVKISHPHAPRLPTNLFTDRITNEIDSLSRLPANNFCRSFYENIQFHINDYYNDKLFDSTDRNNTQWKEILSKNLYSAYAPKFIDQTFYVFNDSEWRITDLNFIRSEAKILQKSPYLERGSILDNKFKEIIDTILFKYDEISGFIYSCANFSYSYYEITDQFPINDISGKIQRSNAYISSGLDNTYVNHCGRLKDELHQIPEKMFNKHVSYLTLKIQQNSGRCSQFNYQSDYSNNIFMPLNSQIAALDNNVYGLSDGTFSEGKGSLVALLEKDNDAAYNYFQSRGK